MDKLLEITKTIAIGKSLKTGELIDIVFYDGKTIEWYYGNDASFKENNRIEIITSQVRIEGKNRIAGKPYFKNDNDRTDTNTFYLEDLSILDYSLFD